MAEQTLNPPKIVALTRKGAPTDQETKDEAFRLWIELGRSWVAVSRRCGIPESTLRNWGVTESWEQRRSDQARAFMPGKKVETAVALRLAAYSASIRLQQLSNDSLELGTKLDPKEVDALTKIVAAGGYSSIGSRSPLDGYDEVADTSPDPDFADMSIDQLRQYELSKRRKRSA